MNKIISVLVYQCIHMYPHEILRISISDFATLLSDSMILTSCARGEPFEKVIQHFDNDEYTMNEIDEDSRARFCKWLKESQTSTAVFPPSKISVNDLCHEMQTYVYDKSGNQEDVTIGDLIFAYKQSLPRQYNPDFADDTGIKIKTDPLRINMTVAWCN